MMTKHTAVLWLALLALVLATGVLLLRSGDAVWAQTSPNYDNSWHVVAAAGSEWMSAGSHSVHGTMGQFAIGPASSDGYDIGSGYWYGISGVEEILHQLYLPLIFKAY
jgi:hypothetical protein